MHEFFSFKTEYLGKARRKHMVEICGCSAAHTTTEMHESCTDSFRSKVLCLQRLGPKRRRGPKLSEVSTHFGPPVPCGRMPEPSEAPTHFGHSPNLSLSNFAAILLQFC